MHLCNFAIRFAVFLGLAAGARPTFAVVTSEPFGKTEGGQTVELYTLRNAHGIEAKVMTYGATLTVLRVPDKQGKVADVVLGFDTLAGYLGDHPHFGGTIGRVANRIAKGR